MSLTCEISGEPIAGTIEEVVATPSGHICIKRLLLQKLAENGGMDPFETTLERPLLEDQLVLLQRNKTSGVAPPRPQVTSLPNLLQSIQTEYDALVLELFDTRKTLEDTRRELSQALYQNDAAVRVVARLSMERDSARQELERWKASVSAAPTATAPPVEEKEIDNAEAPHSKRRKIESLEGPLQNNLPEEDLSLMVETWQALHNKRKPMLKTAALNAPSPETISKYAKLNSKAWHKSSCRSVTCMANSGDYIVTAGKDKQVVVYSVKEEVVKYTFNIGSVPICVDISDDLVVSADTNGRIVAYSVADGSIRGELKLAKGKSIVDIKIHPTNQHICIATSDGSVVICLLKEGKLRSIAEFRGDDSSATYCCGAIHPDGLLYAAGTGKGEVHMWDFKNKVLASTMKESNDDDPVTAIAFSGNGYHLATGHKSATVRFWDLRKQKTIGIMNEGASLLTSIATICFDASAKYAAFAGKEGIVVTTVKEWKATSKVELGKPISGIAWHQSGISSCSEKERAVAFIGPSQD